MKLAPTIDPAHPDSAPLLERFYASSPEREAFREVVNPTPVYRFTPIDTRSPLPPLEAFRALVDLVTDQFPALLERPFDRPRDPKLDGRRGHLEADWNPWNYAPRWLVDLSHDDRPALFEVLKDPDRLGPQDDREASRFLLTFGVPAVAECARPGCSELNPTRRYAGELRPSFGPKPGDYNTPLPFALYGFCSTACQGVVGSLRGDFWDALAAWLPHESKRLAREAEEAERLAAEAEAKAEAKAAEVENLRALVDALYAEHPAPADRLQEAPAS